MRILWYNDLRCEHVGRKFGPFALVNRVLRCFALFGTEAGPATLPAVTTFVNPLAIDDLISADVHDGGSKSVQRATGLTCRTRAVHILTRDRITVDSILSAGARRLFALIWLHLKNYKSDA